MEGFEPRGMRLPPEAIEAHSEAAKGRANQSLADVTAEVAQERRERERSLDRLREQYAAVRKQERRAAWRRLLGGH